MIEAIDLTVRRRGRAVLDAVNFDVRPGQVTGVLGGSGAGKTVLLRRMVGLERGDGETLFDGRPYHTLRHPMREVGLLLGLSPGDPDRTVRGHLRLILSTDRRAAREGAMAEVRRWSGAPMAAGRNALGDGTAVMGSRRSSSDRGGARCAHTAACDAEAGRRLTIAADLGPGGAGRFSDVRGRDGDEDSTGCGEHDRGPEHGDVSGRRRGRGRNLCREDDRGCETGTGTDRGRRRRRDRVSDADSDLIHARHRESDPCDAGFDESDLNRAGNRGNDATSARYRGHDLSGGIEAARRGRPADRIDAVLDLVGLGGHGRTRLSELTEGMATRLGIAAALLGDPKALLLDCPDRGLEPEGVAWLGALLRAFTAQGRAALVTGADTATLVGMVDRVLLLDSGYLVGTRTAEEVLRAPTGASVVVRSPQVVRLAALLAEAGARSSQGEGACLEVHGLDRARVGDLAFRHGIPIHELSERLTGSDPADLVLAACTGRRSGLVVPRRGSPDGGRTVGTPVPTGVSTGTDAPKAKTAAVPAPSAARAAGFEPTGMVRVLFAPPDVATRTAENALRATSVEGPADASPESRAGGKAGSGTESSAESRVGPSTRWGRKSATGSAGRAALGPIAADAVDLDEGVLAVWAAPVASPDEPRSVAGLDGAGEPTSTPDPAPAPARTTPTPVAAAADGGAPRRNTAVEIAPRIPPGCDAETPTYPRREGAPAPCQPGADDRSSCDGFPAQDTGEAH